MTKKVVAKSHVLDPKDSEMDMTSMIDVTFLLLIFFMCTLKFKTLEGRLSAFLPKDTGVNVTKPLDKPDPLDVGIHVRAAGTKLDLHGEPWSAARGERYVFAEDRQVEFSIGPHHGLDLAGLEQQLKRLGPDPDSQAIVLFAGPGTVQAEAISVIDLLVDSGVSEVRIKGAK